MGLREDVRIITTTGQLTGHLFVGADHLPELAADERESHRVYEFYEPATIPATWELRPIGPMAGVLLQSWWDIAGVRARIVNAERAADETPDARS